jgi:hypothetical protein
LLNIKIDVNQTQFLSNLNFIVLTIYGWYYLFRNFFFVRSIYHYILYISDVVSLRYRIHPILKYWIKSSVILKTFYTFLFFRYLYHFYVFFYFNIDLAFLEKNEKYYWWHYFYEEELFADLFVGKLANKKTHKVLYYEHYTKGEIIEIQWRMRRLNYLCGSTFRDKVYTKYMHPKISRHWQVLYYEYFTKCDVVEIKWKLWYLNYLCGSTFRDKVYTKYRHPQILRHWQHTSPYVINFLLAYEVWDFNWVEHHDEEEPDD